MIVPVSLNTSPHGFDPAFSRVAPDCLPNVARLVAVPLPPGLHACFQHFNFRETSSEPTCFPHTRRLSCKNFGRGPAGCSCGGGLWRHRHQPAVHPQRGIRRALWGAGQPRRCARNSFVDFLVVGLGSLDQICLVHSAREQSGRRRHHGIDSAGPSRCRALSAREQVTGLARSVRCCAVLWRQHDHPGHFGAFCCRGAAACV
ncbi:hypothetical protein D3C76_645610 [compost metagenome]